MVMSAEEKNKLYPDFWKSLNFSSYFFLHVNSLLPNSKNICSLYKEINTQFKTQISKNLQTHKWANKKKIITNFSELANQYFSFGILSDSLSLSFGLLSHLVNLAVALIHVA